ADLLRARVVALSPSKTTGLANGTDTVTLMATVADARGNPVGAGVAVDWSSSAGVLARVVSVTDANSQATIVLTAPASAGAATVTAKCAATASAKGIRGDPGKTAAIAFMADPSSARVVEFGPSKHTALADGLDTVILRAWVVDAQGNLVGPGVAVNWTTNLGTLVAPISKTDANSQATVVLTAPTAVGTATVGARAAAGDAGQTAAIVFTADLSSARVVALSPGETDGVANGADAVILTATVADAKGNPVGAGVEVNWSSNLGKLAAKVSKTDPNSQASVVLTAPTTAGTTTITARAAGGDPGKTFPIVFAADASSARVVELVQSKANGIADGADTVSFTATLQDRYGNPMISWDRNGKPKLVGVTVNWTASGGALAAAASSTDASGKATMVLTAPKVAGRVNVTAAGAAGDAGKTASVTFSGGASSVRVGSSSASKTSIVANSRDAAILTALVQDGNGSSAGAGQIVNWSTDLGTLDVSSSKTNADGAATVVLTAGKVAGQASVIARAGAGDTGNSVKVRLIADPITARIASFASSKTSAPADGKTKLTLTATVKDINGNLEGAGITVNWRATAGTLVAPTSSTNDYGVATMELRAPSAAGTVELSARAVGVDKGKIVRVEFLPAKSKSVPPP
ncbi:Ig-like domain-containing protein, partial [Achromobacter sp.]|uniref:Ig-like domain-containing protein n=1 Tax=Achromobacter sp. TaxID=134375 RepID=UPI003C7774DA